MSGRVLPKIDLDKLRTGRMDYIESEPHSIFKIRLQSDFKDYMDRPTDENLQALLETAIDYQNSTLAGKKRRV